MDYEIKSKFYTGIIGARITSMAYRILFIRIGGKTLLANGFLRKLAGDLWRRD